MKKREPWLDYIRAIACFLVALIHLSESLQTAGLVHMGLMYDFVEKGIHDIPVPVFFFCSGYLYQKGKTVDSVASYINNVKNKLINLGLPYIFFVLLTVAMKLLMSDSVNTKVDKGILEYIFLYPPGQMWYLVVLIMCFMLIPTMCNKNKTMLLSLSIVLKLIALLLGVETLLPIVELKFIDYVVWFVLGMYICHRNIEPDTKWALVGILVFVFMALSIFRFDNALWVRGCISFFAILFLAGVCRLMKKENRLLNLLSKYMLQIYLLHTMCAACLRMVLQKMSITNGFVHFTVGLLASFAGPIIIAIILEKSVVGNFIFFPIKTWKQLRGTNNESEL